MRERFRQLAQAWRQLRELDSKVVPLVAAGAAAGVAVGLLIGFLLPGGLWWSIPFALIFGLMGAMVIFNRRLSKAQYSAIEGQPGAAAFAMIDAGEITTHSLMSHRLPLDRLDEGVALMRRQAALKVFVTP